MHYGTPHVLPTGCRIKQRTQSTSLTLLPLVHGVFPVKLILLSCIPRSRRRKVRQVPIYLHVWSWKSPQGIEAQAGVLYYNRPPNLQQKQYHASRKVLPDSFPYLVLVSCTQDNKNNSAAIKALTTQPTASPAGAERWQGGPPTQQNEQSCTALALEQWKCPARAPTGGKSCSPQPPGPH